MRKHSLLFGLAAVLVTGCVSQKYLHHDIDSYSDTYSKASDEVLLMSLARESHNEPVNFLQLGTISSQYQTTTSAGFNPTATRTSPAQIGAKGFAQHLLTFGGSLNAGLVQTPIFQFVPISGTNLTQALMNPISEKTFYTFYDQGYPADLLARVMVESVQVSSSTNSGRTNYDFYVNDPNSESFPKFLNYCAELRQAQLYNTLIVTQKASTNHLVYSNLNVNLRDVVSAISNGLTVTITNRRTVVTQSTAKTEFTPNTPPGLVNLQASNLPNKAHLVRPTELPESQANEFLNTLSTLTNNAPTNAQSAIDLAEKYELRHHILKMRTFETALYTVAKQQEYFSRYDTHREEPALSFWLQKYPDGITTNRHAEQHVRMRSPASEPSNFEAAIIKAGITNRQEIEMANNFVALASDAGLTNVDVAVSLFVLQSSITRKGIVYLHDANGPFAIVKKTDSTNEVVTEDKTFLVRPIMTLTYQDDKFPTNFQKNLEYSYRSQTFVVGDPTSDVARIGRNQDKTVFVLLCYLFSQVAINTQNLPVQQLIQVQ